MRLSEDKKKLIIAILIPIGVGLLSFLISRNGISNYSNNLIKPPFAPPSILFSIVWTILYVLMGLSSYYIYESMSCHKNCCLKLYSLNLVFNFISVMSIAFILDFNSI